MEDVFRPIGAYQHETWDLLDPNEYLSRMYPNGFPIHAPIKWCVRGKAVGLHCDAVYNVSEASGLSIRSALKSWSTSLPLSACLDGKHLSGSYTSYLDGFRSRKMQTHNAAALMAAEGKRYARWTKKVGERMQNHAQRVQKARDAWLARKGRRLANLERRIHQLDRDWERALRSGKDLTRLEALRRKKERLVAIRDEVSKSTFVEKPWSLKDYVFKFYNPFSHHFLVPVLPDHCHREPQQLPVHHVKESVKWGYVTVKGKLEARLHDAPPSPYDPVVEHGFSARIGTRPSGFPTDARTSAQPVEFDMDKLNEAIRKFDFETPELLGDLPVLLFQWSKLISNFTSIYNALKKIGISFRDFYAKGSIGFGRFSYNLLKAYSGADLCRKFGWRPVARDLDGLYKAIAGADEVWQQFAELFANVGKVRTKNFVFDSSESEACDLVPYATLFGSGIGDRVTGDLPPGTYDTFLKTYCDYRYLRDDFRVYRQTTVRTKWRATTVYTYVLQDKMGNEVTDFDTAAWLYALDALGLHLSPRTVWDLIPFSFCLDWVLGVNKFLHQFSVFNLKTAPRIATVVVTRERLFSEVLSIPRAAGPHDIGTLNGNLMITGKSPSMWTKTFDRFLVDPLDIRPTFSAPKIKQASWFAKCTALELLTGFIH